MEKLIQKTPTWPFTSGNLNLSDEQAALPSFIGEMRDDYKMPRYGLSTQWLIFVQNYDSATQVSPGSSGPGPNFGQNVVMSSTTININTISGTSWTAALRGDERFIPSDENGSDGNNSTNGDFDFGIYAQC